MAQRNHVTLRAMMTSLLMMSVDAHYDGADPRACDDLIPQHNSRGRADRCPYYTELSNTTYTPGVPIVVTLGTETGDSFLGFLIQARISDSENPNFEKPVGSFLPVEGTKLICPWNVGLTHTNPDPKYYLNFTWIPPNDLMGKIQFRTTFVQSQYAYWIAQESDILNEGQTTTSTTTTTTTTTPSTSTISTETLALQTETSTREKAKTTNQAQTTPQNAMDTSTTASNEGDVGGVDSLSSSFSSTLVGLVICLCL